MVVQFGPLWHELRSLSWPVPPRHVCMGRPFSSLIKWWWLILDNRGRRKCKWQEGRRKVIVTTTATWWLCRRLSSPLYMCVTFDPTSLTFNANGAVVPDMTLFWRVPSLWYSRLKWVSGMQWKPTSLFLCFILPTSSVIRQWHICIVPSVSTLPFKSMYAAVGLPVAIRWYFDKHLHVPYLNGAANKHIQDILWLVLAGGPYVGSCIPTYLFFSPQWWWGWHRYSFYLRLSLLSLPLKQFALHVMMMVWKAWSVAWPWKKSSVSLSLCSCHVSRRPVVPCCSFLDSVVPVWKAWEEETFLSSRWQSRLRAEASEKEPFSDGSVPADEGRLRRTFFSLQIQWEHGKQWQTIYMLETPTHLQMCGMWQCLDVPWPACLLLPPLGLGCLHYTAFSKLVFSSMHMCTSYMPGPNLLYVLLLPTSCLPLMCCHIHAMLVPCFLS